MCAHFRKSAWQPRRLVARHQRRRSLLSTPTKPTVPVSISAVSHNAEQVAVFMRGLEPRASFRAVPAENGGILIERYPGVGRFARTEPSPSPSPSAESSPSRSLPSPTPAETSPLPTAEQLPTLVPFPASYAATASAQVTRAVSNLHMTSFALASITVSPTPQVPSTSNSGSQGDSIIIFIVAPVGAVLLLILIIFLLVLRGTCMCGRACFGLVKKCGDCGGGNAEPVDSYVDL